MFPALASQVKTIVYEFTREIQVGNTLSKFLYRHLGRNRKITASMRYTKKKIFLPDTKNLHLDEICFIGYYNANLGAHPGEPPPTSISIRRP
jgi:hypothetical protein